MGGKLLFFPAHVTLADATEALHAQLDQAPAAAGQRGVRWTLRRLRAACPWVRVRTDGGMWQVLHRCRLHHKRGRAHVHSPDPHYRAKLASIRRLYLATPHLPETVFLFGDELTFYRRPTLAAAYAPAGPTQPLAEQGWRSNLTWRIIAAVNAWTGQVTYQMGSRLTLPKLVQFYQRLVTSYPPNTQFMLAQDNWPMHFHPDVLAALQPQTFPFGLHCPANWPTTPSPRAKALHLPIRLLCLPTYASWTNPTEKLWRWLSQEVLHLHRHADDWEGLKRAVADFLDRFAAPAPDLLRYIGLSQPVRLYHTLFADAGVT